MKNDRIAAIRERCEKATPGPWEAGCYQAVMSPYWKICNASTDANADFIANSRTDIPYLLTEIDRLNSELLQKTQQLSDLKDSGFCGSCTGCNAPHDPNRTTWCNDWKWRGPQEGGE